MLAAGAKRLKTVVFIIIAHIPRLIYACCWRDNHAPAAVNGKFHNARRRPLPQLRHKESIKTLDKALEGSGLLRLRALWNFAKVSCIDSCISCISQALSQTLRRPLFPCFIHSFFLIVLDDLVARIWTRQSKLIKLQLLWGVCQAVVGDGVQYLLGKLETVTRINDPPAGGCRLLLVLQKVPSEDL